MNKQSNEYGNFLLSVNLKHFKIQLASAAHCWYYPQLPIHRERTAERRNRITAFLKLSFCRAWKHVGHFVLF